MLSVFLALALITLIGSLLRYIFPEVDIDQLRRSINLLVLYIFLPALIFRVIYTSSVGDEFFKIPLAIATGILACLILGLLLRRWKIFASELEVLLLAGAFGNVTYVGLPVLVGVFSDTPDIAKIAILAEITTASLNLIVGSALAHNFRSTKKSENRTNADWKKKAIGKKLNLFPLLPVLKLPALWAVLIALSIKFMGLIVPDFLLQASSLLGNTVSGLMMLSLGMSLRYQKFQAVHLLFITTVMKLLISPAVVFLMAILLQLKSPYFQAVVLEASMPTQLLTVAIADRFQLDTRILAQCICFNTLFSFFTLPLIQSFLSYVAPIVH